MKELQAKDLQAKDLQAAIRELRKNPKGIRFSRLTQICDDFFGSPRRAGNKPLGIPDPMAREPRVNIQKDLTAWQKTIKPGRSGRPSRIWRIILSKIDSQDRKWSDEKPLHVPSNLVSRR